jgi:dihydrofolate reductase
MRKLAILNRLTLDGVMQAPSGPEEDASSDFRYGGWAVPLADDFLGRSYAAHIDHPFDLLLGRKTYDIFAAYWPFADPEKNPFAIPFRNATKYVATHRPVESIWEKTVRLDCDVAEGIRNLKAEDGPELQVYGSSNLIQTLFQHDLVDELWLKIYPITLGAGKRLFAEGTIPAAFVLTECAASPKGVIVANYRRNGDVKTGGF